MDPHGPFAAKEPLRINHYRRCWVSASRNRYRVCCGSASLRKRLEAARSPSTACCSAQFVIANVRVAITPSRSRVDRHHTARHAQQLRRVIAPLRSKLRQRVKAVERNAPSTLPIRAFRSPVRSVARRDEPRVRQQRRVASLSFAPPQPRCAALGRSARCAPGGASQRGESRRGIFTSKLGRRSSSTRP
jgi:hypothetical protein